MSTSKLPRTFDNSEEPQVTEMSKLLRHLYGVNTASGRKDFDGREIVMTPFGGAYGQAGWVIAVEGSPPRGVIISLETERHDYQPPAIFYLGMDRSRRLGDAQAKTVRKFLAWYDQSPLGDVSVK